MAGILGLGLTHYPGIYMLDDDAPVFLRRTLESKSTPDHVKDPRNWPAAMRDEWGADEGATTTAVQREPCVAALREIRRELDDFKPDFVLIWGDDQYENFNEDVVPPFCIYIVDPIVSYPYQVTGSPVPATNVWGEPPETKFVFKGHTDGARHIANHLSDDGIDIAYAYRLRYRHGLAHAFMTTMLYLDYDRKGFDYPIVPFHVNCYGGQMIRSRGGAQIEARPRRGRGRIRFGQGLAWWDGAATARILKRSPYRVAVVASSSWSHAFLTKKNDFIYPDHDSDRARLNDLENGQFESWRDIDRATIEDAGQQEFLNWVCLAGAMTETGQTPRIIEYVESYVLNSNKCFAVFPA